MLNRLLSLSFVSWKLEFPGVNLAPYFKEEGLFAFFSFSLLCLGNEDSQLCCWAIFLEASVIDLHHPSITHNIVEVTFRGLPCFEPMICFNHLHDHCKRFVLTGVYLADFFFESLPLSRTVSNLARCFRGPVDRERSSLWIPMASIPNWENSRASSREARLFISGGQSSWVIFRSMLVKLPVVVVPRKVGLGS